MSRQDRTPVSDAQREEFLDAVASGESVKDAAGTPSLRRKLYRIRDAEPEFKAAWDKALRESVDTLVHVAQSRAIDGWDEPVFHKGEVVGAIRRYDHTLLMFLIKQRDPSYRDRVAIEGGGDGAPPVIVEHRGVKLADVIDVARQAGMEPGD